jgi:hypothetical protein
MTTPLAIDAPSLTWFDPSGTEYPLAWAGWNTRGYLAAVGAAGFGLAPIDITTDPMPRGGTQVRHVQPQARLITLPIFIEGTDHATFLAKWRELARSFAATRRLGPGLLLVARPDGSLRQIEAYYQEGWDESGTGASYADTVVLTLYCPDPYWRAAESTLITRSTSGAGSSFLDPFPDVSSSQTLGSTVATNPGEVEAWPTWSISGPGSQLVATNTTTGEAFTLDITAFRGSPLIAGETVTIVTEPPSVTGPSGDNWTGALDWPGAVLWALQPGDNDVSFVMSGSGAGTTVEASFYARYETA